MKMTLDILSEVKKRLPLKKRKFDLEKKQYLLTYVNHFEEMYNFFLIAILCEYSQVEVVYGGALYALFMCLNYFQKRRKSDKKIIKSNKLIITLLLLILLLPLVVYLIGFYQIKYYSNMHVYLLIFMFFMFVMEVVERQSKKKMLKIISYIIPIGLMIGLYYSDAITTGELKVLIPGILISVLLSAYQSANKMIYKNEGSSKSEKINKINSYNIFKKTIISLFIAVNILILMDIVTSRYLIKRYKQFDNYYITLFISLVIVLGLIVMLITYRKKRQIVYERNLIFIIVLLMWGFASTKMYKMNIIQLGIDSYINVIIITFAVIVAFIILNAIKGEMYNVVWLEDNNISKQTVINDMLKVDDEGAFISFYLVSLMLTSYTVVFSLMEDYPNRQLLFNNMTKIYTYIVPLFFVAAAIIFMFKQPLTIKYSKKLKSFRRQVLNGEINDKVEERLKFVLLKKYQTRLGIRLVGFLLRPFLRMKVVGAKNIVAINPAVFVCNHREIYGPIMTQIYMPYFPRPWIISEMVTKEEIKKQLVKGLFKNSRVVTDHMRIKISGLISNLVLWAMNSVEPIPVYRDKGKEIIKTIKLTVEAMKQDDNILLFPENPTGTSGYTKEPGEFFSGFTHIAKYFYKDTGKEITFYPTYAHSKKRCIFIGEGIRYNSSNNRVKEQERIVSYLKNKMDEMAK